MSSGLRRNLKGARWSRLLSIHRRRSPAARSLPQYRIVIQHIFPDGYGLNRAKQYPRRLQIVGLQTQVHDLAYRGVAQQVIGNLDCDFHRGLGGLFVPFGLVRVGLVIQAVSKAAYFFSAIIGGPADAAYFLRRL